MSYFKKTIKIIIIVLYLEFTSTGKVIKSIYNLGLKLDNLIFCNDYWLPRDFSGLKKKLTSDVFGQPFVKYNLIPIVEDHYLKPHPGYRDPLMLSFHGPSGVGKSFVAEILSYASFIKNKHFFTSTSDFPDPDLAFNYTVILNQIIDSSIRDCERSMFVFDDADYIPPGVIDAVDAFTNKKSDLKYSESLFIFIFQVGSENISSTTLELFSRGIRRDKFNIQEFRDVIKSSVLDKGMVFLSPKNRIIPFLPLEKKHIKRFIENESTKEGYKTTEFDFDNLWNS